MTLKRLWKEWIVFTHPGILTGRVYELLPLRVTEEYTG